LHCGFVFVLELADDCLYAFFLAERYGAEAVRFKIFRAAVPRTNILVSFFPGQSLKPAFRLVCPIEIYVSRHKLNCTVGWPKSGKKTHCQSCLKPTAQRVAGSDMRKAGAERKRNLAHSFLGVCEKHKPHNGKSPQLRQGLSTFNSCAIYVRYNHSFRCY